MIQGYYFLENTHQIQPTINDSIDVYFSIIENNETKVRKILISGNDKTNDNGCNLRIYVYAQSAC